VDRLLDVVSYLLGSLVSVDGGQHALLGVELEKGRRLLVVGIKAIAESLLVVIRALDKGLSSEVVLTRNLRGSELLVVGAARGGVDQTTANATNKDLIIDLELDDTVNVDLVLSQHLIKLHSEQVPQK
jgi:hypothetical protein